jgi:propanediol utilization protein
MKFDVMYGDSFEHDIQVSFIADDMNLFLQDTVIYKEKEIRQDFSLMMNVDYYEALKSIEFEDGTKELIISDFDVPKNIINFIR